MEKNDYKDFSPNFLKFFLYKKTKVGMGIFRHFFLVIFWYLLIFFLGIKNQIKPKKILYNNNNVFNSSTLRYLIELNVFDFKLLSYF